MNDQQNDVEFIEVKPGQSRQRPPFVQRGRVRRVYRPTRGQRIGARLAGDSAPSVAGTILSSMSGPLGAALKTAVLTAAWLLLAGSSFSFGYDLIGPWLFRGALGDPISRFVSGLACLILFDLAYTSSLLSFFHGAKSNAQRALYLVFFLVPFVLGLTASITGFALLADSVTLSAAAAATASRAGQIAVYFALVNLALYGILPGAINPENVQRMLTATIESKRAEQDQLAILMMESEAERIYYDTVRGQAAQLGQQRGLLATKRFAEQWQLPASSSAQPAQKAAMNAQTRPATPEEAEMIREAFRPKSAKRPQRYSVHYLNDKGEWCNTAVIEDLATARAEATELASKGNRDVIVKDFDGLPVWPTAGPVNPITTAERSNGVGAGADDSRPTSGRRGEV